MVRTADSRRRYVEQIPYLDLTRLNQVTQMATGSTSSWLWSHKSIGKVEMMVAVFPRMLEVGARWVETEVNCPLIRSASSSESIHRTLLPCHFGGAREVWHCPSPACCERVRKLYWDLGQWRCRYCLNLHYRCQSETEEARLERRLSKLHECLGWRGAILHPDRERPKGMHSQTFRRLSNSHNTFFERWTDLLIASLQKNRWS